MQQNSGTLERAPNLSLRQARLDRFEYVMVLISIIVGLSIAHVMLGVGGIIDRKTAGPPLRLGLAHGIWLAFVFLWSIQFWWWEFRFSEIVTDWTLGLYLNDEPGSTGLSPGAV